MKFFFGLQEIMRRLSRIETKQALMERNIMAQIDDLKAAIAAEDADIDAILALVAAETAQIADIQAKTAAMAAVLPAPAPAPAPDPAPAP